jgi:hypothetical protein
MNISVIASHGIKLSGVCSICLKLSFDMFEAIT